MELTVLKKNRKFFAATKNGYRCKIVIDDNSRELELGTHILDVEDVSVRSKYGVDLIFKLRGNAAVQEEAGICSLKAPYNVDLLAECRRLGGTWDKTVGVWIFPAFVSDEVEKLDEKYNSDLVPVELTYTENDVGLCCPVYVAGFKLAQAFDRDSGAVVADGIAVMKGTIRSGGSIENWKTVVQEGTVLRMNIPELCLADIEEHIDVQDLRTKS